MRKTRRRFLAAVGATFAIAGCQDGGGPTPEQSPGGAGGSVTPVEEEGGDDGTPGEDGGGGGGTPEDGAGGDGGTDGAGGMGATVQVSEHDTYGENLVDSEGMTLYVFQEDSQGAGESACTSDCASNWPPLTADEEPTAGDGVQAELSSFERQGGDTQVAANGWPLYTFAADSSPGDTTGQGVDDVWWVVDPNGEPIQQGGGTSGE